MKQNFKNSNINLLLIPLVIFLVIKALWVLIEFLWLPAIGVDHIANRDIKALYYRVKLAHKDHKVTTKQPSIKKPVSSIKDIQLLAIYTSSKDAVIAVIYKHQTKVLAIGDVVNGFKFIKADTDSAIFSKNNKNYILELPHIKSKNRYKTPKIIQSHTITNHINNGVTDAGDHKIIDKNIFEHFSNNLNEIYKNIGIQDIKKGNKMLFKVSFIRRGSVFAKLGIKRGDIIKSVNGEEIDSYNKAFSIYKGVKDMQNLTITVIRNNQEVELEYEIN